MAAKDREGTEHNARSPHSARCTALNKKGFQCGAWSLRGEVVCLRHSMSDESWHEVALRGGKAGAQKARERAQLRDSGRNRQAVPGTTLAVALQVIHELLTATIPGSSEPNYEARSYGALAVAQLFKLRDREEAFLFLTKVSPKVAADPQVYRVLDLDEARANLVQAYEEGRISAEELPPGVLGLAASVRETVRA
jgi:hypothetical protein